MSTNKTSIHALPRRGLTSALAVAVVFMAATSRAEDWPTSGLDAGRARLTSERTGARFADGRWSYTGVATARVVSSPVVADGIVVSVDMEGVVSGLRADDGRLVWRMETGSAVHGTPAVARGRVFVPTIANRVVALRLADGALLWTRAIGGMTVSSPTPVGQDLIVATGFPQRHIVRLSGVTGELIWQSPPVMAQFSNSSPAVGAGVAVVGTNGGRYYAFDLLTGLMRWEYEADGVVNLATPLIVGGRVYLAGGDSSHRVHAVELATGRAMSGWPIELPAAAPDRTGTLRSRQRGVSSFSAAGGRVVLTTRLDDMLDVDANGSVDRYLSRESVVALDAASGALVWQRDLGRSDVDDPNEVPKFFLCPTPAAFAGEGGSTLIAAASSLSATVAVLDAASGAEQARHAVAGPALASPVIANGRLVTVAVNGTLEGLASSVNHAPLAPIPAANSRPLDAGDARLWWLPSVDADGDASSYELRIDTDGEVLETWQQQIFLGAGNTSTQLTATLDPNLTYHFAVRARDPRGALSPWSRIESFRVITNPPVTDGSGQPAPSLRAAVAAAQPGETIVLGAGTYSLGETLRIGAGVSLKGAGPGRTLLDAAGLGVGVAFENSSETRESVMEGLTVHGADTCVKIGAGRSAVRLVRMIVRDCREEGVAVEAGGLGKIANLTLVETGVGVRAAGTTEIKNSILTGNRVGLRGQPGSAVASNYNGLFENEADYEGVAVGAGDLAEAVAFADLVKRDLRLVGTQPTTDRGDPADPVGDEPTPNGGRINLGAYGGTADAEPSEPSTVSTSRPATGTPSISTQPPSTSKPPKATDDGSVDGKGCSVAGGGGANAVILMVLGALIAGRRRRNG